MMTKFPKFRVIAFSLIAYIALFGCSEKRIPNVAIQATYDPDFFGNDIGLSVNNRERIAYCFLRSDIDPRLPSVTISQGGTDLPSGIQSNREIIKFGNINVSGGIEIVPPGKRNFFVNISEFPLKSGIFSASVRINFAKCSDLFSKKNVNWYPLIAQVNGNFIP